MSNSVLVNDTVRIKVKFIDINSTTGDQVEVSPVSVNVTVTSATGSVLVSTSATSISSYEYYYDYTPSDPGQYTVTFTGVLDDSSQIIVNQVLYVSDPDSEYRPSVTLRSEEVIAFAADVTPLYLDPESIQSYFPDASLLEIGEIIHGFSHEVNLIYDIQFTDLDPMFTIASSGASTFTVLEYIKAATCCELSRTYGFGGDDELSLQLSDFKITNRSMPRQSVNRGNATTWCQIAAALRKEIISFRVGPMAMRPKGLPGITTTTAGAQVDPATGALIYLSDRDLYGKSRKMTSKEDPMPDRSLKKYDWCS